ncbi:hypothetical protein JOQ06_008735 [Pogonophryne albipinna]|uniref:Carboxylesterase type B domain-containing protein n=1 Tax=Pogonophryne albipinna TaxID=1090488 RepID=A0AAD6FAC1_9TELE|nr:hypothetical protein JOQ06_008735 [Pogonophryne albipinna]
MSCLTKEPAVPTPIFSLTPAVWAALPSPTPALPRADHADDLQYIFGKPFSSPLGYWPRHRDVSCYIIAYWTNFAKTGDLNKGGQSVPTPWPQFNSTGHQYVEIHHDMNKDYVRQKMRMRHVHFWTSSILPNLPISASE